MKVLSAWAAGWIAFYIADHVLSGGRITQVLLGLAGDVVARMGIRF
jgi:uncharacterized membrane protein YeaQ/YmgE (transglycosylase-associated protein family)